MPAPEYQEESNVWKNLKEKVNEELDQSRRELKEITLMLEQSQLEVSKLGQRNASITAHLQHIQSQFENLPRSDIRMAYDSALDAQQRLFVMRGQVEKLQSDLTHLKRYMTVLEQVCQILVGASSQESKANGRSELAETVEMMIQAQEADRQRLSRQMHDGPAQALSNFILQTEIAVRLFDKDQTKAKEELANLKVSATSTFQKVREFIFELRPMMLDDLGLAPTLKRYVDVFKDQPGLEIQMSITGMERRLESYLEVMIFRAVQEILNNAIRHSQASQIRILVDMGEMRIKVSVDDNGKGFNLEKLENQRYVGLRMIKERVEMLGGSTDIESVISQGTRVAFQVPAVEPIRLT
jgi:two-component system sensor histidine kinase DegS